MHILVQIALVALGSALGGLCRWGVTVWFAELFGTAFPWGTFVINLGGSLFLGWFSTLLSERVILQENSWIDVDNLKLMVAVGFTGAYTTFSTFEYESLQMIRNENYLKSLTYIAGSVFLGLVAVQAGMKLAQWR